MTQVLKISVPKVGQKITFNIKGKKFEAFKFLFAKFSKCFRNISYLNLNEYDVKSDVSEKSFETFLSASEGKPFLINNENVFHLYLLSKEFDVPEIFNEVNEFYQNNDDVGLVKNILLEPEPSDELINSAALCFNKLINSESLFDADPSIIQRILESQNSKIESHSNLFNFAKKYQLVCNEKNKDSSFIFKYIDLNKLTPEELLEFASLDKCCKELFSYNVLPIIKKLCEDLQRKERSCIECDESVHRLQEKINSIRSKLDESNKLKKDLIMKNEGFEQKYQECLNLQKKINSLKDKISTYSFRKADDNPLKGIFYYFKKKSILNDYSDYLDIKTPKPENYDFPVSNLLETSPNFLPLSYYMRVDRQSDNWIIFKLKKKKICLTGFTIRTNELGSTIAHPKVFEILGSNDDTNYEIIYKYDDEQQILNGKGKTEYFPIPQEEKIDQLKFYTYIKYYQLNGHHQYYDNDRIISLSAFEIFGILEPI